ncbi:MAG TPA: SDR family oxidoreductase [Candidatus Poseidoniaceae archaeon]|nr:SDR family oxidoreductase [Euryarchaeota archaeon]DAC57243.1 MAG TPA: SDR family oxidoreductase [Candidatus Poseidoniales archaeon]HII37983.1 SDR family oxidoreductase [Candidatus Poseidoniaceae archaeon]|tara:strand:+ start:17200 stop:17877 length:678 start_codon:yes stop_codon:yes gene_type:complete
MRTAVVTGASRGIGSEFVVRLLDDGWRVYAGYRADKHRLELIDNQNLFCHRLDVTDNSSIRQFVEAVNGNVNLLINNAGVPDGRWRNIKEIDDQWMLEVLDINSVGPVRMVKELYDKMSHDSLTTVAMISSLMGSIDDCHSGRSYAYRASKTALNMLSVAMKKEAINDNISFLILHPGWVKTRMGGEHAPVELEESVEGMLELIYANSLEDSGRFVQYDGVDLPW